MTVGERLVPWRTERTAVAGSWGGSPYTGVRPGPSGTRIGHRLQASRGGRYHQAHLPV